ncbi:hypothetical protein ACL02S_14265 [Nocardia sp. 004]
MRVGDLQVSSKQATANRGQQWMHAVSGLPVDNRMSAIPTIGYAGSYG